MSNFSFGTLANTTGIATDKRLKPYSINEVKFEEAKVDVLHSEKTSTDYDILKVRWAGDAGYYEENYFLPKTSGSDVERQPNNWGGESPSSADRALMFFAHCLSVLNPDGFEKLKKVVAKAKDFKEVATIVAKLLNEKKGTTCYLKLTGRANDKGQVFASLPYFTAVSKASGQAYVNNNFLSLNNDLGFTPSEDKKRQEFEKATPTQMADSATDIKTEEPATDNSDMSAATQDELLSMMNGL